MTAVASISPSPARRALDVLLAGSTLAVCGAPLLLLMLAVRLTSRGPSLFSQRRVGQGGRPFRMYKLRTMRTGLAGPDVTATGDARITGLGRVLRRTSLDELPQLWNVLRGEMTLVGPRPETLGLAERYPPECRWIFDHRPGLTGPTQVRMRDSSVLPAGPVDVEHYLKVLVPARTAVDALFLQRPTLGATLSVLADTIRHLSGRQVRAAAPTAARTEH
ncbi:MAG: hypothetical protein QOH56_4268 [Pseudonocardiales bacterium]|nr:hypothetical protein [Pseudonocardiales bacterium]